jgi:hypothetical protein
MLRRVSPFFGSRRRVQNAQQEAKNGGGPTPSHGSSPAPFVYGGAQRGISLAGGFLTGESRWKPLRGRQQKKCCYISGLTNHDLEMLDSFEESSIAKS